MPAIRDKWPRDQWNNPNFHVKIQQDGATTHMKKPEQLVGNDELLAIMVEQEVAGKVWQQIEAKSDYQAFRERLLARHQAKTAPAT